MTHSRYIVYCCMANRGERCKYSWRIDDILTENWYANSSVGVCRRFEPLAINDSVDIPNIVPN